MPSKDQIVTFDPPVANSRLIPRESASFRAIPQDSAACQAINHYPECVELTDDRLLEQLGPEHLDALAGMIGYQPQLFVELRVELTAKIFAAQTHSPIKKIAASAFRLRRRKLLLGGGEFSCGFFFHAFTETKSGADDKISLLLRELVRPLGNPAAC